MNHIDRVICQVHFPPVLSIGKEITKIQERIIKDYPLYQLAPAVTGPNGMPLPKTHIFANKERCWEVTISISSVSIVTTRYTGWKEMKERLDFIISTLDDMFEIPGTYRIGLRFINAIRPSKLKDNSIQVLSDTFNNIVPEGNKFFSITLNNIWDENICSNSEISRIVFTDGENDEGFLVDNDVYSEIDLPFLEIKNQVEKLHVKSRELFARYTTENLQREVGYHD